jgi:hypothetical protein
MSEWNKTSDVGFPTTEVPVLVSNGTYIYAALATYQVADESEGWIWEVMDFSTGPINDVGSYICDDEYDFEYWMPMPGLPEAGE